MSRFDQFSYEEKRVFNAALIELIDSENHTDSESIILTNLLQELGDDPKRNDASRDEKNNDS